MKLLPHPPDITKPPANAAIRKRRKRRLLKLVRCIDSADIPDAGRYWRIRWQDATGKLLTVLYIEAPVTARFPYKQTKTTWIELESDDEVERAALRELEAEYANPATT